MDFSVFLQTLQTKLGGYLPQLAGAVGIFLVGWLIAMVLRASARRVLAMVKLDERMSESTQQKMSLEAQLSSALFWLVMVATLVAVLNALNLEALSGPFADMIGKLLGYLPHLLAGAVLMLLGWLTATLVRFGVRRALAATTLDEKLGEQAGMPGVSKNAANVLFWLIILMFVPMVLSALQLHGLLEPVQEMTRKVLLMAPNIFAALVLGFVGWLVASILRGLVTNLMHAAGADEWSKKAGLKEQLPLSQLVGTLVFVFVFVPMLIAALDAAKLQAISAPATAMLNQLMSAIPNVFAAGLILFITWYVARFMATVVEQLLHSAGADALPEKLGCAKALSGSFAPSRLVAMLLMFFAMLFATAEASNRLGFSQVRDLVTLFIVFGGRILLGSAVLAIGYWLAGLAHRAIVQASGDDAVLWGRLARVLILGLVLAMGLEAMNVAPSVVNLAFALTLGALAVAVALAFGLGGREAAAKLLNHWVESACQRKEAAPKPAKADKGGKPAVDVDKKGD